MRAGLTLEGRRSLPTPVAHLPWTPSPHTLPQTLVSLCHTHEQTHAPLLGVRAWVLMGQRVWKGRSRSETERREGRGGCPAASAPSPPSPKVASSQADLSKGAQGAISPGLLSQRTLQLDSWLYLQLRT